MQCDVEKDGGGPATLLVTAHPDDECMFFTPTLISLGQRQSMHVLCLSPGNYEGLGTYRAVELRRSCARLGILDDRVSVIDDPRLQDGPHNSWPPALIAALVRRHLDRHRIGRVVTFDQWGVSGHPNHVAVSRAVRQLVADDATRVRSVRPPLRAYELLSTNGLRKLTGLLDVPLTLCGVLLCLLWRRIRHPLGPGEPLPKGTCCCIVFHPWHSHVAMREHASQYVWYRRLFVVFSRYSYVNTLTRIHAGT